MRIILLVAFAFIVSCSTATYNPTVYPYQIDDTKLADKPIIKVILAPVSLGAPVRSHLRKAEYKTKGMVQDYLESHGFQILPSYHFENAWKQASRTYGNVYDPSTGKIDTHAWRAAMITTGEKLKEQTEADAIIFADLFEHDIQHSNGMQHHARWYGVTRKPATRGAGGVPVDFNWNQPIKGASIIVTIYDIKLNRIFTSRGGIDTLEAIDVKRSTPAFIRRKKLLKSDGHIEEGIELAFHPFIVMENYPGEKK
ncbi:MAG: hypothetical protein V3T17_13455 [Pseudomonadales bacterium]